MEKDGSQQASEELEQEVAEQAALSSTGSEEALGGGRRRVLGSGWGQGLSLPSPRVGSSASSGCLSVDAPWWGSQPS